MIALTEKDTINIHKIESFGTYDGPGIRMVVFLQGCPFECLYCSNPDTMYFDKGKVYDSRKIVEKALSMKPYFANGGGVTFSGGEPCCQAKQLIPIFNALKREGIHTCLDTNGHIMNNYVEQLLELTDLVLLDVKHIDSATHQKITGRHNKKTLEYANYLETNRKPFWLRYVLVPRLSDDPKHLHQLGRHFSMYKMIEKLEIQPYHTYGIHKWESLGKQYPLKDTPKNTPEQIELAKDIFQQYFREVVVN